MDKRYVSSNRYKKTTKARMQKEKEEEQKNQKKRYERIQGKKLDENKQNDKKKTTTKINEKSKTKIDNSNKKTTTKRKASVDQLKKKNKAKRKRRAITKRVLIAFLLIVVLIGIYYVCKVGITNIPEQIQNVFRPEEKKVENNAEVKIGLNKLTSDYPLLSSSVILKELNTYVYPTILDIDEKYNVKYILVDSIEKINNKEYVLHVKQENIIDAQDIKDTIMEYKKAEGKTVYYSNVKNIESIEVVGQDLKIILIEEDPYYIYNLDIPIVSKSYLKGSSITTLNNKKGYIYDIESSNESEIVYNKSDLSFNEYPKKIEIKKFNNAEGMVDSFKSGDIDMFYTSNYNVKNLLGKQEYSLKTYNNGETIFLFGNKSSPAFSKTEVRKAIAYSINRVEIIKNVLNSQASEIDLPYIFDEAKYIYDKTAGENILLNNGWTKTSGIYSKIFDGQKTNAIMTLIVNQDNEELCKIAEMIKSDVEDIGVKINVEKLTKQNLDKRLNNGNFDLVLANINLNENPNIAFLNNYVNINETINNKMNEIINCSTEELPTKVQELRNVISEEVATIGIAAKSTNMIYKKEYTKIENISYNNIFRKLELYNIIK